MTLRAWSCRCLAVLAVPLVLGACGDDEASPRPQWLVVVSTDAVIPLMGDRMLVELLDKDGQLACTSCRREAVVSPAEKWPVSFGIASPNGSIEVYVRVQLYRGDRLGSDGQPRPDTALDFLGALPPVGEGVNKVGVHLVVDCMGQPTQRSESDGVFETCAEQSAPAMQAPPLLGPPEDKGRCGGVGTTKYMPSKEARSCPPDAAYDGMACVPGGLFFLGDVLAPVPAKDVKAVTYPERLVALGSFLMDRREVTVGQFLQYLEESNQPPPAGSCPAGLTCRDPAASLSSKALHCTFPVTPPTDDERGRALNCVSWQAARDFCDYYEKRLPTEAEWEYAASNGMRETRYSWGDTPARCASAFVARGETAWRDDAQCLVAGETSSGPANGNQDQDETDNPWSLARGPCQEPLDPASWPGAEAASQHTIFALAGNVSEWTLDLFAPYDPSDTDPLCWVPTDGPVLDLVHRTSEAWCSAEAVEAFTRFSVRGGSWRDPVDATWSASRNSAPNEPPTPRPEIGFRCARDLIGK